jgi:hypothetical protein
MRLNFQKKFYTRELLLLVYIVTVMIVIVWLLDLQLPMKSVPIITKGVSPNPAHGLLYSIYNIT